MEQAQWSAVVRNLRLLWWLATVLLAHNHELVYLEVGTLSEVMNEEEEEE